MRIFRQTLGLKLNQIFGKIKWLAPALYILAAFPIWYVFSKTNPDGLANIWLIIYTFPIVIVGTFIFHLDFPYFSGGYYGAHALYFCFSVTFLAVVLFFIFYGLQKISKLKR